MDRERGQDDEECKRGYKRYDDPPAPGSGGDRLFDPEALDPVWWVVRPDVDYVPGNTEAEVAAREVCAVYRFLKHRSRLDRVDMVTDVDGNPFLIIGLSTAGVFEMVTLLRAGASAKGLLDDSAGGR